MHNNTGLKPTERPDRPLSATAASRRPARRLLIRGLVGPALGSLFLFIVLIGLGVWQVHRLHWKDHLLAALDQAESQPALPLTSHPRPFEKVKVSGHWSSAIAHYGVEVRDTPQGPRMGSQLVVPLLRPNAPAVLSVLGWQADGVSYPLPPGEVQLTGYVRPPEHRRWFSAGDNPVTARFFTLDPYEISKTLAVDAEPFTLVVLQDEDLKNQGLSFEPVAATRLPRPLNNHLSYALTWFGLAATQLVVFGIWVRRYLLG